MIPHQFHKIPHGFARITLVRTQHTGNRFLTVKRRPGIVRVMVVQKTGGKTDSQIRRHIGQGGIVVGAVEITYLSIADYSLLHFL